MEEARLGRERIVRDAKLSLILDAARDVFALKGFHESRLEDIAVKAGFSKASLYNYFADKETIFLSLAIREFDQLLEALQKEFNPDRHVLENLRAFMQALFTFLGRHFNFFHSVMNLRTFSDEHLPGNFINHQNMCQTFKLKFAAIFNLCESIMRNGNDRKEFISSFGTSALTMYVMSLMRGMMFHWATTGSMGDVEHETDNLIGFLTFGLNISGYGWQPAMSGSDEARQ